MQTADFAPKQMISRGTQTSSQAIVQQSGRVIVARQPSNWQGRSVTKSLDPSDRDMKELERCCERFSGVLEKIAKVGVAAFLLANPMILAACGFGYFLYKITPSERKA